MVTLLVAAALAPLVGAAAGPATVEPAPGTVLTASPQWVSVRLTTAPTTGARLEVLDAAQADLGNGPPQRSGNTLRIAVPPLRAGIYTVVWGSGTETGASAFTIWTGGPLPPSIVRAAHGGPTQGRLPAAQGLLTVLVLLCGLVGVGALACGSERGERALFARRASGGLARGAAVLMALAASAAAGLHTAAVVGVPVAALAGSPLTLPVLLRGVGLAGLVTAVAALVAAALAGRQTAASAAASVLVLAPALLTIPALHGAGGVTFLVAFLFLLGLGLFAGAWPHALMLRAWANPRPRLVGLALALAAGIPLLLHWRPVEGALGLVAVGAAFAAAVLGRPNASRGSTLAAAALALAAAVALAPTLAEASAAAGSFVLPPQPQWGYEALSADGHARLAIAPFEVGVNVVRLTDPAARGASLDISLTDSDVPGLTAVVPLRRVSPGVYALRTDALSVAGHWQAAGAGASFQFTLGAVQPAPTGCRGAFTGFDATVVQLDGPIAALATDPGDGALAVAATGAGVYATQDGGRHWRPAGDPGAVTALAIGQFGQWYAATAAGLRSSQDGGAHWGAVAGIPGVVGALAIPLYPPGSGAWATVADNLYRGTPRQTPAAGWGTEWRPVGSAPNGVRALLALPGGTGARPPTLLAAGARGLQVSTDGGARWVAAVGGLGTVGALAQGGGALWAGGADALSTALGPAGPWRAVPLGVPGAVSGVATGGTGGGDLFTAVQRVGLLHSADGGATWHGAGCAGGGILALAGTYPAGTAGPTQSDVPLVYVGDAAGHLATLWRPGTPAA